MLNRPSIVVFQQQRADEAPDRIFVGEDTDDIGAPFDLTIEPFERIDNREEIRGADRFQLRCDHRDRGTGSTTVRGSRCVR